MRSKYNQLADHLATLEGTEITLTFAKIEAIVGSLPKAARHVAGWWGATTAGRYENAHALYWWYAGFVAERVDFAGEMVTFRRVADGGSRDPG